MRVTWFLLFLQIQCKKKQFLIQTENEVLRNSSEKQSQGIAESESKIETIIEGKSKNKSKNLAIVKRAKQMGEGTIFCGRSMFFRSIIRFLRHL